MLASSNSSRSQYGVAASPVIGPLADAAARRQTLLEPGARRLVEALLEGLALVGLVRRELVVVALELEVAALGDLQRVLDRLGDVLEGLAQVLDALHVELVGVELPARRVVQRLPGLDAEQHLVGARVLAGQVVAVVGREQRDAEVLPELLQHLVAFVLDRDVVVLDLQVVAVAEDLQILGRELAARARSCRRRRRG